MTTQETIKQIITRRDQLTEIEADNQIENAREAFEDYLDASDIEGAEGICAEFFDLEPDYLEEFI